MQVELEQQQPYILFSSSIRSDETRKTYTTILCERLFQAI